MNYGYANQAASAINGAIDTAVDYVKENGVGIALLLGIAYFFRTQIMVHSGKSGSKVGYSLKDTSSSNKKSTSDDSSTQDDKLRLARLRQQERANDEAKVALKARKEKERLDKERKNSLTIEKWENGGDTLGKNAGVNHSKKSKPDKKKKTDYNPMQPWSGNSTGFKAARRSVRKG